MLRRCIRWLGSTNRYTDGSGRKLESNELPRDLYLETISNRAYPVKGEHWQPVVADKPSPHKGNVIISGAGVLGLTLGSLFALRGWHTTVLEKSPRLPKRANFNEMHGQHRNKDMCYPVGSQNHTINNDGSEKNDSDSSSHRDVSHRESSGGKLGAGTPVWSPEVGSSLSTGSHQEKYSRGVESSNVCNQGPQVCPPFQHPFIDLEYTILTRRAMDVLEMAGVRVEMIRDLGVPVSGILDHPGDYNSWLTYGLTEHHPFAVRMLSIDLFELRRYLEGHINQLPNQNAEVFYEHVIEAVYPLRQQVVVRPWEKSVLSLTEEANQMSKDTEPSSQQDAGWGGPNSLQDRTTKVVTRAKEQPQRRRDTSLVLSPMKWDAKYANDAVDYDLLVSAEGVNSRLRDLLDVEGFAADIDMGTKWFLLRSDILSHDHIHRWLRKRKTNPVTTIESYHVCSAYQVPMCTAFPRIDGSNLFSLMVYMPIGELEALSNEDVLKYLLADIALHDPNAELRSFTPYIRYTPTIFCENLFNSVGLPSGVMVGDAGHSCHPFWMQGLALGLEDGINLLNQVDAYSRHFYDALKQYSNERGVDGDALRALTDRCLFYQRQKHKNPFIRFQNAYQHYMNNHIPRSLNDMYNGSTNHLYSKSIETMLNGRGYTSYEFAEKQQNSVYDKSTPTSKRSLTISSDFVKKRKMTSSSNAGFFFTFGDDNTGEASLQSPPETHTEIDATIPLARFPWYTLSEDVLQSWLSCYPRAPSPPEQEPSQGSTTLHAPAVDRKKEDYLKGEPTDSTFGRMPSPLSLTLPTTDTQVYTLYYQTAPNLRSLVACSSSLGVGFEGCAKGGDGGGKAHGELRDIIPGRYYGGLKVWSCAPDLARYVVSLEPTWRDAARAFGRDVASLVFAEVGCGQALPALAAICVGARNLVLQDYNKEVLEWCVKPNIGATIAGNARSFLPDREKRDSVAIKDVRVRLVHGDWEELRWSDPFSDESVSDCAPSAGCDVVLGSDVTFDRDSCWKLSQLLQRWLRPITGMAFIATKVYYFGTNGGSLEFAQCASRLGLRVEEVARIDEQGEMKRVILKVQKTK